MARRLKATSQYLHTYTSYSGHDMVVIFEIPLVGGGVIAKVIGMCQTITYSLHNEKMPVRVLGDMNPKGYVFGNRTIAGTMIFTVFDEHWSNELISEYKDAMEQNGHMLDDELPPINVTISMANEYGDRSRLALYGVTFVNEGQVMSIQDTYTENTFQFYAKDVDYLTSDVNKNSSGANAQSRLKTVNHKVSKLNSDANVPIDIPENTNKAIIASRIKEELSDDEKIKKYDVYDFEKDDLKISERDKHFKEMQQKYENVAKKIQKKYLLKELSTQEYRQEMNIAKTVYIKRRNQADYFYAQLAKEEIGP